VEIELSVTFAPELREAVREAADEAGLSLSEWLSQAAEAKIRADGQARILEEAERERRRRGLREFLDEYQAEHGAFTDEEMAEASRKLGMPWPPEEDDDERARA
jgi:TRAP-type C4-dicarboxylate transport system substrate-binding protein